MYANFLFLFFLFFSLYWLGRTYEQPNQRLGVSVLMLMYTHTCMQAIGSSKLGMDTTLRYYYST